MRTQQIKTIDINAIEWFDRVNGNSYFAGTITINYGMENTVELKMPFQYGYGNYYEYEALDVIKNELNCFRSFASDESIWRICQKSGIILRRSKKENCKKSELLKIQKQ